MVGIRLLHGFVFSETLVQRVIILHKAFAAPFHMAFNAKMIVGFFRQLAGAAAALENGLRQDNAGRYPVFDHLVHRFFGVLVDIKFDLELWRLCR